MIRLLFISFLFISIHSCKENVPNEADKNFMEQPNVDSSTHSVIDHTKDRYAWQKPEIVIDKLGDIKGKVIADIGTGTGYFAFRLISKAEKVIAVDIDPNMLNLIEIFRENLDSTHRTKIETRLATPENPMLQNDEVDVAIIINTIGYIKDRRTYLNNLMNSLKPNGEIMIVDFKMKTIPDNIASPIEYRVNLLELESLLTKLGYVSIHTDDRSLDYQFILKAKKE